MNSLAILLTLITAGLLLVLPRRWAPLPLLMAAACITVRQQLEIGPFHFTLVRTLIVVGVARVMMRGEWISGGMNSLDRLMIAWAIWAICSLPFHKPTVFIFFLGETYTALGVYFLFRVFVQGPEGIRDVFKMVCILMAPLAAGMLMEKLRGVNPLSWIGFGLAEVTATNGHYRAQGPFGHPILAGTVGAVCLPMALYFWRRERKLALLGLAGTGAIVFASGSSGPVLTVFSVLGAMAIWRIRDYLRAIRWLALLLIIALDLVMNDPVYFLLARIDITGGSTGHFRAALIQSAIAHVSEWAVVGTDYTRHWMPTGITANPDSTDITNYYLWMGVWGGLLLMLLFVSVLVAAFVTVGKALRANENAPVEDQLLIWTLGAILFGHATTFISISYFDQTVVFLYLVLAAIGSLDPVIPASIPVSHASAAWAPPGNESDLCHHC
jgi:hypothetical protein